MINFVVSKIAGIVFASVIRDTEAAMAAQVAAWTVTD